MAWTAERVQSHLNVSEAVAQTVIGLVRGTIDPFTIAEMEEWRRQCYSDPDPKRPDTILRAVDTVIGGFGVEAINGARYWRSYWLDCCALYVNQGDTYDGTIVYDTVRDKYVLTSTGDFCERYEKRYGIL
jgi:hypothetical protein